ncbi:hypothetical protein THAOC_24435, partial [Thalassiosira oceanica]
MPPSESALDRQTRPAGPGSCRAGQTDEVVGFGRKVASRKALAELYKSLSIDEFGSTELAPKRGMKRTASASRDRRSSCRGHSRRRRRAAAGAAASGDTAASRRPTELPPGAVAEEERHAAYCGGGRGARMMDDTRRPVTLRRPAPPGGRVVRVVLRPPAGGVLVPLVPYRPSLRGTGRSPSGLALPPWYEQVNGTCGPARSDLLSPRTGPRGT